MPAPDGTVCVMPHYADGSAAAIAYDLRVLKAYGEDAELNLLREHYRKTPKGRWLFFELPDPKDAVPNPQELGQEAPAAAPTDQAVHQGTVAAEEASWPAAKSAAAAPQPAGEQCMQPSKQN